jgi:hypothetical protein
MATKVPSSRKQLDAFIARYSREVAAAARAVLAALRRQVPGALELVYDNYNALAIGYGPTERASEAILSVALFPRWVSLFFLRGAGLSDPHGLLKGGGKQARHVVLKSAADLEQPALGALIVAALQRAPIPIDPKAKRRTVIKSISAKQRPRRPR